MTLTPSGKVWGRHWTDHNPVKPYASLSSYSFVIAVADYQAVLDFLQEHQTLTLATVGPDGTPHAAALFYAYTEDLRLIFLSAPDTQHAQHIGNSAPVAVTIQADGQDWRRIIGLQLHGIAGPADENARRIYLARFSFIARTESLVQLLRGVRFYVIMPTWVRLIDNRLGFGHKQEWHFHYPSHE